MRDDDEREQEHSGVQPLLPFPLQTHEHQQPGHQAHGLGRKVELQPDVGESGEEERQPVVQPGDVGAGEQVQGGDGHDRREDGVQPQEQQGVRVAQQDVRCPEDEEPRIVERI